MVSEKIKILIPVIQQYFAGQPVSKAWLFGSSSCGEERTDSDIDILVQYNKDAKISLFTISRMTCALQERLNKKVDLVEEDCLLPFATESVNRNRILIYERTGLRQRPIRAYIECY